MTAKALARGRSGEVTRHRMAAALVLLGALLPVPTIAWAAERSVGVDALQCPVGHAATISGTIREITQEDDNWRLSSDDADGTCLVLDVIGYGVMPENCPAGGRFVATGRMAEDEDGFPVLETETIKCQR